MRQEFTGLDKQMQAIWDANSKATQTRKRLDAAQQRHNKSTIDIKKACVEYNLARAQMIVDSLVKAGMGLCQSGHDPHIASEEGMMGIVRSGTYTRGGEYYAHDEPYIETRLYCRKCREKVTIRPGRDSLVELNVRAVWTKIVLDAARLYSFEGKNIREWANHNGIPARIKLDSVFYFLGDEKLELVR